MITTPRLLLRRFSPRDLEAFLAYRRDPETARYQGWTPDYSDARGEAFIAHVMRFPFGGAEWVNLAVEDPSLAVLVGDVGLRRIDETRAEIGFTFAGAHRGRGLAREAVGALVQHGFETLELTTLEASVDARNLRAARLVEALAFVETGRAQGVEFKGELCEEVTFTRHARER